MTKIRFKAGSKKFHFYEKLRSLLGNLEAYLKIILMILTNKLK